MCNKDSNALFSYLDRMRREAMSWKYVCWWICRCGWWEVLAGEDLEWRRKKNRTEWESECICGRSLLNSSMLGILLFVLCYG